MELCILTLREGGWYGQILLCRLLIRGGEREKGVLEGEGSVLCRFERRIFFEWTEILWFGNWVGMSFGLGLGPHGPYPLSSFPNLPGATAPTSHNASFCFLMSINSSATYIERIMMWIVVDLRMVFTYHYTRSTCATSYNNFSIGDCLFGHYVQIFFWHMIFLNKGIQLLYETIKKISFNIWSKA